MSGLFASLNASVNALNAHSRAVETAGKNLANVSNSGYARQRVIYGDRGTVITPEGAQSLGLEALGVEQLRDKLLDQQVGREAALTSYYQAQQNAYQRAQAALGQDVASATSASGKTSSATDTGLAAALDDIFNVFQSFASNPTDPGQRQSLLQSASILTDRFQLADTRIGQVQTDLHSQASNDIADANVLLQTIAELNGQIGRFEINRPGSAVDLRDQRQASLEKLSAKLPFESTEGPNGQMQIACKDSLGNPVILVDLASVQGSLALDTSTTPATVTGGSGTPPATLALTSGSIQGSITASSVAIQDLRDQLNLLAKQLVTSVNKAYDPTNATGKFFDPAGLTAGTIKLATGLTAGNLKASDGGPAGDNTIALAIAQLASKKFSTAAVVPPAVPDFINGSFGSYFSSSVSGLGQALAGATSRVNDQTRIEQLVRSQRDAISGVSLDEEMADLMKYQRAFQASSRVFQTIDSLLETVVTQMGR